jgi:hypothetical protein
METFGEVKLRKSKEISFPSRSTSDFVRTEERRAERNRGENRRSMGSRVLSSPGGALASASREGVVGRGNGDSCDDNVFDPTTRNA